MPNLLVTLDAIQSTDSVSDWSDCVVAGDNRIFCDGDGSVLGIGECDVWEEGWSLGSRGRNDSELKKEAMRSLLN